MFWNFGIAVSSIDQLFDRDEQPTLEQILAEQEIIQELKGQNERLINFLTDEQHLEQLIMYIVEGGQNNIKKVCVDVLTSGVALIEHTVFEHPTYLETLWAAVHVANPDPPVIMRSLTLFTHFVTLKSRELYHFFAKNNINFVDDAMQHLDFPPACELLIRMLTNKMDECVCEYQECFLEKNFSRRLIDRLSAHSSPETASGCAFVISELIRTIRTDSSVEEPSRFEQSFVETLFSDELMDVLIRHIVSASPDSRTAVPAATVLSLLLNLQRCGHLNGDEFNSPGNVPARFIKFSKTDFSSFTHNVKPLLDVLMTGSATKKSFGRLRLLVLEAVVSLVLYNDDCLAAELSRLDVPNTLMDLFEVYPQNNLVHSLVQLTITSVLLGHRWKGRGSSFLHIDPCLVSSLFSTNTFMEKLLRLSEQNTDFIGHVRDIQRSLARATADSHHKRLIVEKLKDLPPELKSALILAEEKLAQLDELEAIDQQFLHVITDDIEISDPFGCDTPSFVPMNKSFEFFRLEKAQFAVDDVADRFEGQMQLTIDLSADSDPFSEMVIQTQPPPYQCERFRGIVAAVQETIQDLLCPDNLITSNQSSDEEDPDTSSSNSPWDPLVELEYDCNATATETQQILDDSNVERLLHPTSCETSPLSPGSPNIIPNEAFDASDNEETPDHDRT